MDCELSYPRLPPWTAGVSSQTSSPFRDRFPWQHGRVGGENESQCGENGAAADRDDQSDSAEREHRKEVEQRLDEAMRELREAQELVRTAQREVEESRRRRAAVGGDSSLGGTKGGGLDVATGDVETHLFLLEQRMESQERESCRLKVSLSTAASLTSQCSQWFLPLAHPRGC